MSKFIEVNLMKTSLNELGLTPIPTNLKALVNTDNIICIEQTKDPDVSRIITIDETIVCNNNYDDIRRSFKK